MSMRRYLLFLGILAIAVLSICIISDHAECRDAKWDGGGGDALASTAANWDDDTAPIADDNIILDGTSTKSITWDVSVELGTFSSLTGYSGTVTQGSNIETATITWNAGTFQASSTYSWTVNGNVSITVGTFNTGNLNLILAGDDSSYYLSHWTGQNIRSLVVSGDYTWSSPDTNRVLRLQVDADCSLNVLTGKHLIWYCDNTGYTWVNNGQIYGAGYTQFWGRSYTYSFSPGYVNTATIRFKDDNQGADAASSFKLTGDLYSPSSAIVVYGYVNDVHTLDSNGYNITSTSITVNAYGVLSCGSSSIYASSLDSSLGSVTPATSIWTFTNNALVKMAAGGELYDVEINGTTMRLGSDITMNSMAFIGLTASHPYGWYENGTRTSSVTTTSSGTYSVGSGVFAWDNATLKITPVITIDLWEHTDAFRNTVWQGYDYWADHDCDLLVTWSMTASEDWLSIDDTGNITGTPDEDGTCYYTITVTHSNGEIATVSGYVDVVTSATQSASMTVSALLDALVLVLIVSTVIVMINRSQRS